MRNTHVLTSNGRVQLEVDPVDGVERVISRELAALDGEQDFAASLARLPEGLQLADRLPKGWPHSYLQSAGTARAMTVEMRTATDASGLEAVHVVVGRADDDDATPVTITWPAGRQVVRANEVFAAEEATRIYLHYYAHDTIPEGYVTRLL